MMNSTEIDVNHLQKMLRAGKPVTVLDVRPGEERAEWAIPGSLHLDAYDALRARDPAALSEFTAPADRPIVAVCAAGRTSQLAAQQLRERGFQALSLAGGMKAWSLAWNQAEVPSSDPDVQVIQIRRTGKGCLSYLIGSEGRAAVIDASLDPQVYLDLAQQHGWQITHVLDTHIHADHLSRGRLLAASSGAALYLPAQNRTTYPFTAVHDNDTLYVGAARLTALHTPGHTLESTCYWLNDDLMLTGDTLFLSAVGRPDLEADPAEARRRAHLLYGSLQRLLRLPASTRLLPGHTSEPSPFDGQPFIASLAQARQDIQLLALSQEAFVETLLQRIPATPPNHQRIVELNEHGRMPEEEITDLEAGANRCAIG